MAGTIAVPVRRNRLQTMSRNISRRPQPVAPLRHPSGVHPESKGDRVTSRHQAIRGVGFALAIAFSVFGLSACQKGGEGNVAQAKGTTPAASGPALLLSAEDLITLKNNALTSGPAITGS